MPVTRAHIHQGEETPTNDPKTPVPQAVLKLTGSGSGGRLSRPGEQADWTLDSFLAARDEASSHDSQSGDDESIDSDESSSVTELDYLESTTLSGSSSPSVLPFSLEETPPEKRRKKRKPAADCHVLIPWSSLLNLVTENMACAKCGQAITHFERRTIGIATELDFRCSVCKSQATAEALRTDYAKNKSPDDFIRRERRVDSYEMNYRLILATQLMGEGQVGGSIIGLMLDLSRETFRNPWGSMEESIGEELVKIGARVADSNLKIETLGKVAILMPNGKAKYPVSVSYDMGWQKSSKTYDSLSGQGLMIGDVTKRVVCYKNYSKACRVCQIHEKKKATNQTLNLPVRRHACPRNHDGSSKGMEAKAVLECVNKIWTHSEIAALVTLICIDDDASTKGYLSHKFEDLDFLNLS